MLKHSRSGHSRLSLGAIPAMSVPRLGLLPPRTLSQVFLASRRHTVSNPTAYIEFQTLTIRVCADM